MQHTTGVGGIKRLSPEEFDQHINELNALEAQEQARRTQRMEHAEAKRARARELEEALEKEREARRQERRTQQALERRPRREKDEHETLVQVLASASKEHPGRLDKKLALVPLHASVFITLLEASHARGLEDLSEMMYQLANRRLSGRQEWEEYQAVHGGVFYEFDHGMMLGAQSWSRLFQSQLLFEDHVAREWGAMPVVLMNRHDEFDVFKAHCMLTVLALRLIHSGSV